MRLIYYLVILFSIINCSKDEVKIPAGIIIDSNFPRWLKSNNYWTEQTSGITFLGSSENEKSFLLADDIGKIHRLTLSSDTGMTIINVNFSQEASNVFKDYQKLDFEEIFYDKQTNDVYISVEGNGESYFYQTAIFKVIFRNNNVNENEIINFEKVIFEPQEIFRQYINLNIGYEGITADSKYFYLGLEGRIDEKGFADSTFIIVAEKNTKKIIKTISTRSINVHTIGGLYSDVDFSLWGVDRNNRRIFLLHLDEGFNVDQNKNWQLESQIPNYKNHSYTASFEGITVVDDCVYLVDDPWYQFFKPSESVLDSLDEETNFNFNNFVPLIYKFNLIR